MFNNDFSLFMNVWPWIGLGFAVVILIIAFGTDWLRQDKSRSRWRDPAWLAWLGAVAYMLHNVEEYGIDITGTTLAFPQCMEALGMQNITELTYLTINLSLVWVMGPLLAVLARRYKGIAPAMSTFALVNGLGHIAQAINLGMSNPGLITSIFIFLPLGFWTIHICFGKGRMKWSVFAAVLGVALLYTALGVGLTIVLVTNGIVGAYASAAVILLAGALCFYLWYLIGKKKSYQFES